MPCEIHEERPFFVAQTSVSLSRDRFVLKSTQNDFAQTVFNRFDSVPRDTRLIAASMAYNLITVSFELARTASTHLVCGLRLTICFPNCSLSLWTIVCSYRVRRPD